MAEKPTVTVHQGNWVKLSRGNEAREDVVIPPVGRAMIACRPAFLVTLADAYWFGPRHSSLRKSISITQCRLFSIA